MNWVSKYCEFQTPNEAIPCKKASINTSIFPIQRMILICRNVTEYTEVDNSGVEQSSVEASVLECTVELSELGYTVAAWV